MVLGFKKQFVSKIFDKTKIHTIRVDKNRRWRVGLKIHFATGVRTKNYNQFFKGECKGVQNIYINPNAAICKVLVDSNWLTESEFLKFIKADGFENEKEFFEWFNEPFYGRLIHWTDLKY